MKQTEQLHDQTWDAVNTVARPEEVEDFLFALVMNKIGMPADSQRIAWLRRIFKRIVSGVAETAAAFDETVGRQGFQISSRDWLQKWVSAIKIRGEEYLPADEPLIVAANHPGTFDSLAVASILPRDDLKIVTAGNPFFRSLPNTREYLIYATNDSFVRMATIRKALRHLGSGGSLLLFPSGKLDPDPNYFLREARQSLARWSESLEFFLRKAPQSKLVIAINSGFVAPEFLRNPLLRLHPVKITRQYIAEFFQVINLLINHRMVSNQPQVTFSEPFSLAELSIDPGGFQDRIQTVAANLLEINAFAE